MVCREPLKRDVAKARLVLVAAGETWSRTSSQGAEPTNWFSFFSGPAWEYDEATGEYFLHVFSRKQPDLNWENPEVRQAVYSMMRWWVGRGVDGFRMDVVNMLSKAIAADGSLPDGELVPGTTLGHGSPYFMNGPRIHEFLHEMNTEVLAGRGLLSVGEMPGASVADAKLYTDPARHEVDMVFTFEHVNLDQDPHGSKWDLRPLRLQQLKANLGLWQDGLVAGLESAVLRDNHDQPRIVSRWGDDGEHREVSAKSLATVLHLLRGTPYIYQGEEFAMTNAHFTEGSYRDIESINYAADAARRGIDLGDVLHSLSVKSRNNAAARRSSGLLARTQASRRASRGSRSIKTTRRSTPRRRWPTSTPCFTTTAS